MSELYLVRHGQASLGAANYDQLSPLGFEQSHALGEHFARRDIGFDMLYTGTMARHRQTLDAIAERVDLSGGERAEHAGLNEYDFQALVRSYAAQQPNDPLVQSAHSNPADSKAHYRLLRVALLAWSRGELDDVPESHIQFIERVNRVSADLQAQADSGSRILAISSGGAIARFVGSLLALAPEKVFELNLQARNTGVSQFFFNAHKYNLLQFNGIAHLEHPERTSLISF
ncbi:MAG: histidine phosphatase family protein [Pseudomonadales bacterium]